MYLFSIRVPGQEVQLYASRLATKIHGSLQVLLLYGFAE